ncbi:Hsp20/alpha crystallin family protein [Rhodococcus xishaensis]|uniref:Hsp20/alpha crystallin family protein n=1 Tax=Rhodococcus xishaensis TaxID=2487364 RepID=A0A438ATB3_9NOCA|nr:Hsp20/alpha crystallin family protein [Rhodococcus xishaensis]RVW01897.1 Hsp20/alpha crystallin family protein [Rhodococcus xishaensis]
MSVHSPHRPTQALMPNWPMMPDWSDLVARFESMPPWTSVEGHMIRVEEHLDADRYTVRAELPGVDPAKDVDISVREGQLTIKAERAEKKEEGTRSEFRYGNFYRSMLLPTGADEDAIDATYGDGILTVSIPLAASSSQERHVEVKKMSRK